MRADVAAGLEHDLRAGPQSQGSRIPISTNTVDVERDRTAEREKPVAAQATPPETEEGTERLAAFVPDDAAGIERPHAGAAAGRDDPTEPAVRSLDPDGGRDDHDATVSEQLDVHPRPLVERRPPAHVVRSRGPGGRVIARPGSHRRRHDCDDHGGKPDGEPSRVHRRQGSARRRGRGLLCLVACTLAAGLVASTARADGDPASDYLIGQQVFLGYDAKIPRPLEQKLVAAVASANKNGFPIKVAVIASRYDMGSVPALFGKPQTYARFLDAEDSKCWWGGNCGSGRFKTSTRLLVVMPNGLGFAQWKHSPKAGYKALAGITVRPTPAGLATAATEAVIKLAAASGVKVSTRARPGIPTSTGGGSNRVEIVLAVVVALLIGVAALLLIRRRARSTAH